MADITLVIMKQLSAGVTVLWTRVGLDAGDGSRTGWVSIFDDSVSLPTALGRRRRRNDYVDPGQILRTCLVRSTLKTLRPKTFLEINSRTYMTAIKLAYRPLLLLLNNTYLYMGK